MCGWYKESETTLDNNDVQAIAKVYGIQPWTKRGTDRYYLNYRELHDLIGLDVDYYNSGNVRNCQYKDNGEDVHVANCRAYSRYGSKVYIENGKVYSSWNPYDVNIAEVVAKAIEGR